MLSETTAVSITPIAIDKLPGVGPQIAKYLARLNIHTIQDLLLHLPLRYQDRTQITPIRQVLPDQEVVIEGVIQTCETPWRGRTKLLCQVHDGTGKLTLRFFNVFSFQKNLLQPGIKIRCYGEARWGVKGLEMFHPEIKVIQAAKDIAIEPYFTAIYPATDGLGQATLRKLINQALMLLQAKPVFLELIPKEFLPDLPTFIEAIFYLHQAPSDADLQALSERNTAAHQRLIVEELLAHRISLLQIKSLYQTHTCQPLMAGDTLRLSLLRKLPFKLTSAQERVLAEILADLRKPIPMLRLVQGDVGSGKTVIALLAMLQAIANGYQAALMVPTELLAEQHYRTLQGWCETLPINIALLTGQIKSTARKKILTDTALGNINILIGTHALFQKEVEFKQLVLIVTDEQHRFGVEQRALLRSKGIQKQFAPHQLMLTATPIPRTLAMSLYADLDCSIIDELPPGRIPIKTSLIANARRQDVMDRLRHSFAAGKQAYWVCALIDSSEAVHCQAATTTAELLSQLLTPYRIGLIHGRLPPHAKAAVMQAFINSEIQLLVATTVIEVGVDVPNASIMVIENAERLGLAQLHQLRGRVGRGNIASHCILLYQAPLSDIAKARLAVMRETNDGFKIAEHDLQLRGPGEVLGTRQTGDFAFKIVELTRDMHWLPKIQQLSQQLTQDQPTLIEPLISRWLGEKKAFSQV